VRITHYGQDARFKKLCQLGYYIKAKRWSHQRSNQQGALPPLDYFDSMRLAAIGGGLSIYVSRRPPPETSNSPPGLELRSKILLTVSICPTEVNYQNLFCLSRSIQ
jgi:hypothetical protein